MLESLPLEKFFASSGLIADVRSPAEFRQGHIPGSFSLPLFTDEERARVGTVYKQQSQQDAIDLGLQIVGPKLCSLVRSGKDHFTNNHAKFVCWRGGMRSGFMARLFESIGFTVVTLQGGYKSFRQSVKKVLDNFTNRTFTLKILGGLTGSGKTGMLKELSNSGNQVIDLEYLANHRGSAFGHLGLGKQPSQEHFENLLADSIQRLNRNQPVWMEDESRVIGKCVIPSPVYSAMSTASLYYVAVPLEQRLNRLLETYGQIHSEELMTATRNISKRLGTGLTEDIIILLQNGKKREAFTLLLSYYDKAYTHYSERKSRICREIDSTNLESTGENT